MRSARMKGTPRDVLDWIAYMELLDHVSALCDSTETTLMAMPSFLRGNPAATRGRLIVGVPTI